MLFEWLAEPYCSQRGAETILNGYIIIFGFSMLVAGFGFGLGFSSRGGR